MRANAALAAMSLALSLGLGTHAFGLAPHNPVITKNGKAPLFPVGQKVIRPGLTSDQESSKLKSRLGENIQVRLDARSGVVRLLSGGTFSGVDMVSGGASLESYMVQAFQFVDRNPDMFKVGATDLELVRNAVLLGEEVQFVKFRVLREGLVIADSNLDFRFKRGKLVQVVSRTYGEAAFDGGRDSVDSLAVVSSQFPDARVRKLDEFLRVVARKDGYELVRVAAYRLDGEEPFEVQVETATGRVYELKPVRLYASGSVKAAVYPRKWNEEPVMVPVGDVKLKVDEGEVVTADAGTFDAPDDAAVKLEGFEGNGVRVMIESGDLVVREGELVNGFWDVSFERGEEFEPWEDQNIAQPMAYYHLKKVKDLAAQYINPAWFADEHLVTTNFPSNCNAFWNGISVNLFNAGGECAHSGLIADVIYHEWGHGLDFNTGGIADVPYSEGFADATSMLLTDSNILAPDFYLDGRFIRDMEPDKVYPRDQGEPHAEGLIIGGTFWDLYKTFKVIYGRERAVDILANLHFKSILTAVHYTDVYDAFLVIDDDDGDLSNGTPHFCIFNTHFAMHGLAEEEMHCKLAVVEEYRLDDSRGNGNGYVEPGEAVDWSLVVSNPGEEALSGLKGTLTLIGGEGITLSTNELVWDDIPVGGSAAPRSPVGISIARDVPCGQPFTLHIRLYADHRNLILEKEIELGEFRGEPIRYTKNNLPYNIPDQSTAYFDLDANDDVWGNGMAVYRAHLKFDITHPYIGDITVWLTSPDYTEKRIRRGVGNADDMHFDEDISHFFKGLGGLGSWVLSVNDKGADDTGTLDSFELTLTPSLFHCERP